MEEGERYLNKFIKHIEEEDYRQKTIFKRRGYQNDSKNDFHLRSSSIDDRGTLSSNLSSVDFKGENTFKAS